MAEEQLFLIIKEFAVLIVALGGGRLAVPIVAGLKKLFKTHGGWTILLAMIVSGLLGTAGLVAEGVLTPGQIMWENLSTWGFYIFLSSQAIYHTIANSGLLSAAAAIKTALDEGSTVTVVVEENGRPES